MLKKLSIVMSVLVVMGMTLSACTPAPTAAPVEPAAPGKNRAAADGKIQVAVVVKSVTSDYWKLVGAGVEDAMKADPNIEATFTGPNEETDIEGQIRMIEAQISAKVDAIAVAPSQADQLQPTLQKAVDAGIPVILDRHEHRYLRCQERIRRHRQQVWAVQWLVNSLPENCTAGDEVAIIRGAAGDPVHNLREEGATRSAGNSRDEGCRSTTRGQRPCQRPSLLLRTC